MKKSNETKSTTLAEILFPVSIQDNEDAANSEYCKTVWGVLDGKSKALNYCSDIYQLVDNSQIFPKIESILNSKGIEFTVEYKHINHVRFYADYTITDKRFEHTISGTNDTIQPLIRVRHSYNGLTKYNIMFGYFRLVCSNGMVIPVEEMNEYNLNITGKHTAIIINSLNKLEQTLIDFTENKDNVVTNILKKYDFLANSVVENARTRVAEILEAVKINAVETPKLNTIDNILARIEYESTKANIGYNGRVTDWLVYNGINAYINDDTLNIAAPEVRTVKDSKVFEYILEDVM